MAAATIQTDDEKQWQIFDMLKSRASGASSKSIDCNFQDEYCSQCGSKNILNENITGDLVCSRCGLVLEASMIDTSAEWCNYTNEDGTCSSNKQRASSYVDSMFPKASTATTILSSSRDRATLKLKSFSNRSAIPYHEKMLFDVKNLIQTNYPELPHNVVQQAIYIYKKYRLNIDPRTGKAPVTRANKRRGIICACVKKACGIHKMVVDDHDLARRFSCSTVHVACGTKLLEGSKSAVGTRGVIMDADPKVYIDRFASKIGLPKSLLKVSEPIVARILDARKNNEKLQTSKPRSVAALCIWEIIAHHGLDQPSENHNGFSKQFVASVTGVSETTIGVLQKEIST